jgi:MFS family permease
LAGPLIGGLLIASLGWRAIFFINLPLGLFAMFLTVRYARETTQSRDRGVELPGQLVAVIALTALAAAMAQHKQAASPTCLCWASSGRRPWREPPLWSSNGAGPGPCCRIPGLVRQ